MSSDSSAGGARGGGGSRSCAARRSQSCADRRRLGAMTSLRGPGPVGGTRPHASFRAPSLLADLGHGHAAQIVARRCLGMSRDHECHRHSLPSVIVLAFCARGSAMSTAQVVACSTSSFFQRVARCDEEAGTPANHSRSPGSTVSSAYVFFESVAPPFGSPPGPCRVRA